MPEMLFNLALVWLAIATLFVLVLTLGNLLGRNLRRQARQADSFNYAYELLANGIDKLEEVGREKPALPSLEMHYHDVTSKSIDLYNRPLTDEEIEMGAANMQKLAEAHARQEIAKHKERTAPTRQAQAEGSIPEWDMTIDSLPDPCNGQLCESHK